MTPSPRPQYPVASTRFSDPASIQDLIPAARALARGETDTALTALEVLATQRPDHPPTLLLLGLLAWRSDDLADAIALVRRAHDAEPENGSYAEVLASLYALAGDLNESLFLGKLATGMGLDATLQDLVPPDFPTFGQAFLAIEERPLATAARNAAARDRPEQAIRYLRDHLKLFPRDLEAQGDLVRLLLTEERFGEAAAAAEGLAGRRDAAALSLIAQARCAAGEHAIAAGTHDGAVMVPGLDPLAACQVAAHRLSDLWWCEPDTAALARACGDWVAAYCPPPVAARRRPSAERLTIGFLVAGEVRPDIRSAVAQICRAFNRQTVRPIAFGYGPATHPRNSVYRGAFELWRDVRQVDGATMARIFSGEGLDVVIDTAGFGCVDGVLAVAQSDAPLRLLWPQLPVAPDGRPYDARLAAGEADVPGGSMTGGAAGLSVLTFGLSDVPASRQAAMPGVADGQGGDPQSDPGPGLVFGCDMRPGQATREMLSMLAAIAMAVPDATIAIRDNGFSEPALTERLLQGFGDAAAAVTLVKTDSADDFCRYLDVAVAPTLPASAQPVVAALVAGCPVLTVAPEGPEAGLRDGSYAALLTAMGLGALVCDGPAQLIRRAAELALDRDGFVQLRDGLRARDRRRDLSASVLADRLEQAIRGRLTASGGDAAATQRGVAHG
ncbi:hypothetical protein ACFOGJ_19300 [Marinibaculum pumilum]|uniref:Tetratricopeptide repeat protein n=1 Tax=Marinibaculum pumilum TaxID=1766165 RepID=A0ABV7L452_9PROT